MVEYAAYKKSLFGCKSMQVYVEIKADLEWKESIERSDPEGGEERVGGWWPYSNYPKAFGVKTFQIAWVL